MGFNISGIVINQNLRSNPNLLSKILGRKLYEQKEIDFETASENWKEPDFVDVYFSENGTLVFAEIDMCVEAHGFSDSNILTFALSETSMTFSISYTENDQLIREKLEADGEIITDEGPPLAAEEDEDDMSEVIWKLIEQVLGISFHNVELEEECYRFSLKMDTSLIAPSSAADSIGYRPSGTMDNTQSTEPESQKTSSKNWWQFWK